MDRSKTVGKLDTSNLPGVPAPPASADPLDFAPIRYWKGLEVIETSNGSVWSVLGTSQSFVFLGLIPSKGASSFLHWKEVRHRYRALPRKPPSWVEGEFDPLGLSPISRWVGLVVRATGSRWLYRVSETYGATVHLQPVRAPFVVREHWRRVRRNYETVRPA